MLKQLRDRLRSDGLRRTLRRIGRRLVRIQRHRVFIARCSDAGEFRWLPGENVHYLPVAGQADRLSISEKLRRASAENREYLDAVSHGDAQGLAILRGGELVHSAFLLYRNKTTRLLGFDQNTGLLAHAYTAHAYRGRGCHARSAAARVRMAKDSGLKQVISVTSYENIASQRGLMKGGMQYLGDLEMVVLLNALVVRYKRPDKSLRVLEVCL